MTLILIPGHLCDSRLYAPQMQLRDDIIIADITQDDDLGAMAERLLADAPAEFDLAGLSMGGMIAMEVLARAPHRVRHACLMATDPTAARPVEQDWRAGMQENVRRDGLSAFADPFTAMFFAHDADVSARLAAPVAAMVATMDEDLYHRQSHALNTRRDMLQPLADCPVPVQIIVGSEDRICPPKLHQKLAAILPDATLTQVEDCGHLVSLERPDVVNAILRAQSPAG